MIRRVFGPYERALTEAYRRIFIDLDDFVGRVRVWVPRPLRILEVGCGEGAVAERLAKAFPEASITAIDITPGIGRLYRGDPCRVTFLRQSVHKVAQHQLGSYDLVVLCDVLHHVPSRERSAMLRAVARAMAPDGRLVVKDWLSSRSPIHWLCRFSDRYLTGDDVNFFTIASADELLTGIFGPDAILGRGSVRPWSNNFIFLVHPSKQELRR